MSERDENTIPVTLDGLDYEAPALGGLTYKELMLTICISFIVSCMIMAPLAQLILGNYIFGLLISVLTTVGFTAKFTKKAYILKKDRPSYMVWIEMQKKIQNEGIWGIKIPMAFIKTTYWHTGKKHE